MTDTSAVDRADEARRHRHPLIGTIHDGTDGIYIGRLAKTDTGEPNPLGNPYRIGKAMDRDAAIKNFRLYLAQKLNVHPEKWLPMLAALRGERLLCHCAPMRCHAEVLIKASEWAFVEIGGVEGDG